MVLILLIFLLHPSFCAYLHFSPQTNPKNSSITLPVPTDWLPNYQKPYTLEFWLRPFYSKPVPGEYLVMSNPNDWHIKLRYPESSVQISNQDKVYCSFEKVPNKYWTHLAFSFDIYLSSFTCYRNGTQSSSSTLPAIAKYPNKLLIGYNFTGNIVELRVWVDEIRSPESIFQFFQSFYSTFYPPGLLRLYRLAQDPSTKLTDLINSRQISIPSDFKSPFLSESPESLQLCLSNFYKSGKCQPCSANCDFCKSKPACFQTKRKFIDFERAGLSKDIISLGNCKSTSIASIEFWFRSLKWKETSAELLKIPGFFRLFQKSFSNVLVLEDGLGKQVLSFETSENWEHLTWVYTNKTHVRVYRNLESSFVPWTNASGSVVYIGGSSASLRFQGIITDLRLWKSARSQLEVYSNLHTLYLTIPADMFRHIPLNDSDSYIKSTDLETTTYKDLIISLWRPLNCTLESCIFFCPFKYFLDEELECRPCHSSCQSCDGPFDVNCTTCLSTDLTIPGINSCFKTCPNPLVAYNGICIEACPLGMYSEVSQCKTCLSPCKTCENALKCLSCDDGFTLNDKACKRTCPNKQFRDELNNCQPCDATCGECSGRGSNMCLSCNGNLAIFMSTCVDKCPLGYFETQDKFRGDIRRRCDACDPSCFECSGAGDRLCIKCSSDRTFRDLDNRCLDKCPFFYSVSLQVCVDGCSVGSFYDSGNKCYQCHPTCYECTGPSEDNCKSCSAFFYQNKCLDSCPPKTYALNNLCQSCKENCEVCSDPSDCIQCSANFKYKYMSSCLTSCPSNTFLIGTECIDCEDYCDGCLIQKDSCIKCKSDLKFDKLTKKCLRQCYEGTFEFSQTCVAACPAGYFGFLSLCKECPLNCLSCDEFSCFQCESNYYLSSSLCVSTCPKSFFPNILTQTCLACHKSCATCAASDDFSCNSCSLGYFVYNTSLGVQCVATCPSFTFTDADSCLPCGSNCEICISSTNCVKCQKPFYLISNQCKAECQPGDIQLQSTCCSIVKVSDQDLSSGTVNVNIETLNAISIEYDCDVQIGNGVIRIEQNFIEVLSVAANEMIVLGNQIFMPVDNSLFDFDQVYTLSISDRCFLSGIYGNKQANDFFGIRTGFKVLMDLVCIINQNSLALEVKKSEIFFLDSNGSFDPSEKIRTGSLERVWDCVDISSEFREYMKLLNHTWQSFIFDYRNSTFLPSPCDFFPYSPNPSSENLSLPHSLSINSVILFTLTLKSESRICTSKLFTKISPDSSSQVSIQNKPQFRITSSKKLFFSTFYIFLNKI